MKVIDKKGFFWRSFIQSLILLINRMNIIQKLGTTRIDEKLKIIKN
jgi:hypothetical protein